MMEMSPAGELAVDASDETAGEKGRGTFWIVLRTGEPDDGFSRQVIRAPT